MVSMGVEFLVSFGMIVVTDLFPLTPHGIALNPPVSGFFVARKKDRHAKATSAQERASSGIAEAVEISNQQTDDATVAGPLIALWGCASMAVAWIRLGQSRAYQGA